MFMYAQFLVEERVYMLLLQLEYTCIKIISNEIYLLCDALCSLRSFCYFFFLIFFFNFHFSLKLFLICFYFSGDLSLTVLIKCVLNKKSVVCMQNYLLHPRRYWLKKKAVVKHGR